MKLASKEVKVRRLKAQILDLDAREVSGNLKGKVDAAIESRQLAIEYLEKYDMPNMNWKGLERRFGFAYYEYMYRGK